MGQRTNGLSETDLSSDLASRPQLTPAQPETEEATPPPIEIEHEIEDLRTELTGLVQEIDRRRHEALDIRLQLRRNASVIVVALGTASLLLVGRWALKSYRYGRRASTRERAENLMRALAILSREGPERVLRTGPDFKSAAMSALGQVAGAAGRRAIAQAR